MNVYLVEYENAAVFSTARKAIEDAIGNGYGESMVFVSYENDKMIEYPLNNVKRAIAQIGKQGFIRLYSGNDPLTISQKTLR